jgi:hypothetical protein
MNLSEAKIMLESVESELPDKPFVIANIFERNGRKLHLGITDRLRRIAKRGRIWKSNAFLTALKNAEYGFDESHARSSGGSDGIFLLDRNFKPENQMMRKIFDRFLDKEIEAVSAIASELKTQTDNLRAVRLVSHHLRLLGLLHQDDFGDWIILVDYDDTK